MVNFLKKYSLSQAKIDTIYNMLGSRVKLEVKTLKSILVKTEAGGLIRSFSHYKLSSKEIEELLVLRSYEIDVMTSAEDNRGAENTQEEDSKINREFKSLSASITRNYFVPIGNYQHNQNGLLTKTNGAICSSVCAGVTTGKFLSFINNDALLSYSYSPGQGFTYSIMAVDQGSIVSYFANLVNLPLLQTLESPNVRVDAIDVNNDGLEDIVISVTDPGFDNFPVLLLNDQNNPFMNGYQLSSCSSANGAVQVRTGYYFGTHQAGGLWCQYSNNIGLFFLVDITAEQNLVIGMSQNNWCFNSVMITLDYNGDKYDDAFCVGATQQQLFISARGMEMESATADGGGNVGIFSIDDINTAKFVSGDFDGNGMDDLLRNDNNGYYYLYLSDGKKFFDYKKGDVNNYNAIQIADGNFCGFSSTLLSGKFNYDVRADLWCSNIYNDAFLVSALESDRFFPKVRMLLTYRNFDLNIPSDLSPYNSNYVTSKNFVNALSQGTVNYNAQLELNIETTNSIDSFRKDVSLINPLISGRVTYYPEHAQYSRLLNGNSLDGYVLQDSNKNQIPELDLMTPPGRISANILSQWDKIYLKDNVNFSVAPNGCATAQMKAIAYKDVQVPYSVQGFVTLIDEKNVALSGSKLLETAQSIINKPVSLAQNGQAMFNSTGIMLFTMPYAVESAVLECRQLSSLQSNTALPKLNAALSYRDFSLTIPQNFQQNSYIIKASKKIINNKQYGNADFKVPLSLEVKLPQTIDSLYQDIKPNNLVAVGEVKYLRNPNDVQLLFSSDISGYKLSVDQSESLSHSWFTPFSQVSSELFSRWDKLQVENDVNVILVPNQCVMLVMTATLYQNVRVPYSASGYFSAKTLDGYPVVGDELVAAAQSIFNKDVQLDSRGEVSFQTSGTLVRNLVGDIVTEIHDC